MTARTLIALTDAQIEDAFNEYVAIDYDNLVFTHEAIADFKAARDADWAERGSIIEESASHLWIERAQAAKGDQRRDVVIIDFGAVRGVAKA